MAEEEHNPEPTSLRAFEKDQTVWVPDEDEGFTLAKFECFEEEGVCRAKVNGKSTRFKLHTVYPVNPESQAGAPDNTRLMYLHDPHLLDNVRFRFGKNQIYTYTAHILIVVNPYKYFPELYSTETVLKYRGKPIGVLPPHVFAIADRAYRNMIVDGTSQGIIVSGESGAGKTETAKHVMAYLATVGGMEGGMGKLERQILEANPLLEAFGNAKTLRNNNSSRFGKFTKIDFDSRGKIIGATIDTYLLEKSRLLFQATGERNYHIFYQMIRGLPKEEVKKLKLKDPEHYHYINQGGETEIKGVDDAENFRRVQSAMDLIGMAGSARTSVWRMLAGILHLGNITFEDTEEDDSAQIVDLDTLELVAEFLQVDILKLRTGLLSRSISAGRSDESFEVPLTVQQAQYSRDSLASLMYSRLFSFMVEQINASLKLQQKASDKDIFIGVLDIYGFESFKKNSFEQLTINYANEKVHQYFIKNTFVEEQEIYKREAVKCPPIQYEDNQDALNMLEDKTRGIFAMIDDEGKKPKSSDANLLANMHTAHRSKTKRWIKPSASKVTGEHGKVTDKEAFIFRHFAGDVCYSIDGFLDKNTQQITIDAELVLTTSEHPLFPTLFPELYASKTEKKRRGQTKTVSSQFLSQLNQLMEVLERTTPSFIRCIKPNVAQVPGVYEGNMCLDQLRCSGMLEALSLMQIGYPTRCPYIDLYNMYSKIMPEAIRHLPAAQFVEAILMALELDRDQFALGVTRVFFKAGQLAFLEQLTGKDMGSGGIDIVAKVKRWLVKKRWQKACYVIDTCSDLMEMNVGMKHFRRFRKTAELTMLLNRTVLRKARAIRHRNAALTLQAAAKMAIQRKVFVQLRDACIVSQAHFRMLVQRKPHVKQLQEKRMRVKIEEELRNKEARSKGLLMPESSGPDPYATAKRTKKHKRSPAEAEAEMREQEMEKMKKENEERARDESESAKAVTAMREQMERMQAQFSGTGPAPGSPVAHTRRISGSYVMSEDLDARLKKIEEYLELLPGVDENVIVLVRSITGKSPPPRKRTIEKNADTEATEETAKIDGAEGEETDGEDPGVVVEELDSFLEEGDTEAGDKEVKAKSTSKAKSAPVSTASLEAALSQSTLSRQVEQMQQMMLQQMAMSQAQNDLLEDLSLSKSDEAVANSDLVRKLQDQNSSMEDMLIKARVDIEVKAAESGALDQKIKELKQEIVDLKSEKTSVSNDRDGMSRRLQDMEAENKTLKKQSKENEQENAELREKVTDLADQLINLKRSVKELIQIRARNLQKQQKTPSATGEKTSARRMSARSAGGLKLQLSGQSPRPSSARASPAPPGSLPPPGTQSRVAPPQ